HTNVNPLPDRLMNWAYLRERELRVLLVPRNDRLIPSITKLDISINPFIQFPIEAVCALANLRTLTAERIGLKQFPIEILELKYLTDVNFSDNELYSLPETIGRWKSIERLRLEANRLESVALSLGLLLGQLKEFTVSNNCLPYERWPNGLGRF